MASHRCEDVSFVSDMLDLFQLNYIHLPEHLQSEDFPLELGARVVEAT